MDGGTIAGTLFIVFVILKLTHVIDWSWVWVTSPLWIDIAATIALGLLLIAIGGTISAVPVIGGFLRRRRARRIAGK